MLIGVSSAKIAAADRMGRRMASGSGSNRAVALPIQSARIDRSQNLRCFAQRRGNTIKRWRLRLQRTTMKLPGRWLMQTRWRGTIASRRLTCKTDPPRVTIPIFQVPCVVPLTHLDAAIVIKINNVGDDPSVLRSTPGFRRSCSATPRSTIRCGCAGNA